MAKEPFVPNCNVPPVTLTSPVKVLAAPITVVPAFRLSRPAWKAGKLLSPAKSAITALISPPEVTVCAARISAFPTRLIVPAVSRAPTRMLVRTRRTVLVWTSRKMDLSSAVELSIVNCPPDNTASPKNEFIPERVRLPVPALFRPPNPLISPLQVVSVLSSPAVRLFVPSKTDPAPASEPIPSLPPSCSVAPPATVTAEASLNRSAAVVAKRPAFTLVAPV